MIKVIVIDDEASGRKLIIEYLAFYPELVLVGEANNGVDAVRLINEYKPDLIFLDVQMPGMNGFEILPHLEEIPRIIFSTAYDQFALKAFEVHALDYLLKPYDDVRFGAALQRVKAAARRRRDDSVNNRLSQLMNYLQHDTARVAAERVENNAHDRILVKSSGEIFFLKADEIDWIEAEGDYMKFHVAGRAHLMRETMARLEARLDGKHFIRIHRSTIVNINRVRKLSPSFAGEYAVVLVDGTKLKLSRGYHDRVAALLKAGL